MQIGDNIMGVNNYMDFERTLDVVANKSSELLTHMQRDHIYADLGYITSSGEQILFIHLSEVFIFFVLNKITKLPIKVK